MGFDRVNALQAFTNSDRGGACEDIFWIGDVTSFSDNRGRDVSGLAGRMPAPQGGLAGRMPAPQGAIAGRMPALYGAIAGRMPALHAYNPLRDARSTIAIARDRLDVSKFWAILNRGRETLGSHSMPANLPVGDESIRASFIWEKTERLSVLAKPPYWEYTVKVRRL